MSGIKFIHVSMDKYYEFIKSTIENENIIECATYVDMKENKIYFVERPKHGGMFDLIHDGDSILSDSCKAINSMGLS